jgi:hypothetical protein
MKNNFIRITVRLILIALGFFSLIYQTFYFIFSALNRSSNERDKTLTDTVQHFFTLVIIVWFIVSQIKMIAKKKLYMSFLHNLYLPLILTVGTAVPQAGN